MTRKKKDDGQKELPDYEKLNSDESLEKILETSGKAA